MKNTCSGCRAEGVSYSTYGGSHPVCDLGFKITYHTRQSGRMVGVPLDECPKPRTIADLIRLTEEKKKPG